MSRSATSIFVFGLYLIVLGLIFVFLPNTLLSLFRLPTTDEVWIRLVGMLLLILAFYYMMAGLTGTKNFFYWTMYTRLSAIVFLLGFVAGGFITPVALLFWLGDLAGAVWTWTALRSESNNEKLDAPVTGKNIG